MCMVRKEDGLAVLCNRPEYNTNDLAKGQARDALNHLANVVVTIDNTGYKNLEEILEISGYHDGYEPLCTYRYNPAYNPSRPERRKMSIAHIKEVLQGSNNNAALASKPVLSDSTMQLLREFYYSRTPVGKSNPTVEEVERYFSDLFNKGEISEHSASANFNYVIRDIMDSYIKLEAELARFKSIPGFTNPVENNQLLRQQLNDKDIEIANLKAELAKLNQDSANAALQTSQQVAELQARLDEVSKNNSDALMYIESEKDKSELDIIKGFLTGAFTMK